MIKNPCDIPLHKLICKDFGYNKGFGHCSLNNKTIHWFNQVQMEVTRSHLRQELLTENRWYNSLAHKPPKQNQTANAKTTPRTKNHNQPTPKETCTCITWETLFWRETLHFSKVFPSKLGEDGANILWRRGDEQFNFHLVSFFVIWCVGDHSYGTDCCMNCVLLCAPCWIQKNMSLFNCYVYVQQIVQWWIPQ